MKKALFRFAAIVTAFMMFASCSVLKTLTANALTSGTNTGSSLLNLYRLVQASKNQSTSSIDLTNTSNLINLGQILAGASALPNATSQYTQDFSTGLINGSSNLVNNNNLSGVLGGLLSMANLGTSTFSTAATQAAAQAANTGAAVAQTAVNNSTSGASEALSALGSIFSLFK